jgi:hypothetical protein
MHLSLMCLRTKKKREEQEYREESQHKSIHRFVTFGAKK